MHANVQWRHDPATGEEAPYYRLKESYRDVRGTVHSLIVLNIGFEPELVPRQMHRIVLFDLTNFYFEGTNRQLKTDLNLRPIYHQRDDRSDAHLFLGMLAYWVVNTIRHQLKEKGENAYWTEIVRCMSTQKLVTTTAFNALGEKVELRLCSEPSK